MKISSQTKHYLLVATMTILIFLGLASFHVKAIDPNCHLPGEFDPLLVDLGQDGIHLGKEGEGVVFDLAGNGNPIAMQWTAKGGNEAFIVVDKNGNGIVDDGSELLTNFNLLLLENIAAPNGFADLAQYDHPELGGNDDGFITVADQVWSQINLWLDINADGISTLDEMLKPEGVEISRFNTVPKINNRTDPAGNILPLWAWAKNLTSQTGNTRYKMIDVFFKPIFN